MDHRRALRSSKKRVIKDLLTDFFVIHPRPDFSHLSTTPPHIDVKPESCVDQNKNKPAHSTPSTNIDNDKTEQIFKKTIIWFIQFFIFSTLNYKISKMNTEITGVASYTNKSVCMYFMLIIFFSFIDASTKSFFTKFIILIIFFLIIRHTV